MTEATPLELSAFRTGAATTVYVAGDVDLATSERFLSFLREQLGFTQDVLTIELADVTFLGSEGLRVLILLRAECAQRRIGLVVGKCSRIVLRTLELGGLTGVFLGDDSAQSGPA